MNLPLLTLPIGLAGLILLSQPLHAAAQCGPHDKVAGELATKFGEAPRAMGLAQDNTVMEVYASAESGTWTITVTMPSGVTCLVAAGQNFETALPMQVAKGDPA